MFRGRRAWPYTLLAVFALPALWPLAGEGLPRTNDNLPHLYRAVELGSLVAAGDWLPRWAPHLVFGLGYPVFNYFPYLAHYLVVAGHALGLTYLVAYQAACALALLAAVLAAMLLMLPESRPLWQTLPLLQLTLFPWRLLGPLALFTALLAGSLFAQPGPTLPPRLGLPALGLALAGLVIAGLPFASPPREPVPAAPGLADLAAFEVPPDFIGTTTGGEYLPSWVMALPDVWPDRQALIAGEPMERFAAGPGTTIVAEPLGAVGHRAVITASAPVTVTYRVFYFPVWQARLDGQPAPITPTEPEGLMAVAVPGGRHTLELTFGSTPPRTLGLAFSAVGLLGALVVAVAVRRKETAGTASAAPAAPKGELAEAARARANVNQRPTPLAVAPAGSPGRQRPALQAPAYSEHGFEHQRLPAGQMLGLAILALALAAGRPLMYDTGRTPLLRPGLAWARQACAMCASLSTSTSRAS